MKPKRNRIVIDFANTPAGQRPKNFARSGGSSRVGRILGIILALLVVILIGAVAGAYFWWRHYQTQPGYALALLVDAAQRNDNAEMDRLLDTDKITDNFVSQVRERATGSSSGLGSTLSSQIDQTITKMIPKLKPTVHDALLGEIQRLTDRAAGKPLALVALAIPYFVTIKQDGDTATAETTLKDEQIKLTMQRDASGHWQIVAVEDDKLVGTIVDSIKKDLPKTATQWQDELERGLKRLILPTPSP